MAVLAEIADRAKINIELVSMDAGARELALSSGKVDAVFWLDQTKLSNGPDVPEGIKTVGPFYENPSCGPVLAK